MKEAELNIKITLDDKKLPESITWQASDSENKSPSECKAILLSLWDAKEKNTLKIDLWTKEMPVNDMKQFFYETLLSLSDSFLKATGEKNIVEDLRDYCLHFAEKMGLTTKSG